MKNSGKAKYFDNERPLAVKLKTAKGRKISSTRWLQRQLNDPYVVKAKSMGYKSRAAFKLLEIDKKFKILKPGNTIIDLGCSPGGWSQVAIAKSLYLKKMTKVEKVGRVIGIDINEPDEIPGLEFYQADFLEIDPASFTQELNIKSADVILSDMASSSSGHKKTDHLRIVALCEAAAVFANFILKPGGIFVSKVLTGGAEPELQKFLKKQYVKVVNFKPPASRKDSSEKYVVATGFRPQQ